MCDDDRTRSYLPLLKQHDRQAQNDFTIEFFDCAYRKTYSQFHPDDRIECVYDAFLKIFAEAHERSDLKGSYVHTAVRWQCRNRWLRQQRRPSEVPFDPSNLPDGPESSTDEWAVLFEIFNAAGLTDEEISVVWLKVFEGRTWEEVAEILKIPVSRARRILQQALEKLRRWYKNHAE
jgi:RNA polymerase sigma factor (sigma-70 family)